MLHMALDSVAAPLWWLMPFGEGRVELFAVPAVHPDWKVSFVTHWPFAAEIAICLVAAITLWLHRTQATGSCVATA